MGGFDRAAACGALAFVNSVRIRQAEVAGDDDIAADRRLQLDDRLLAPPLAMDSWRTPSRPFTPGTGCALGGHHAQA